uniref:Putative site-specific DNA endonuclease n=1 Tax=Uronema confervicola TaxID=764120 RepID=A0A6H1U6Y8_9CHLO|nr:putative site-specific DNA endonuclease [Uronema confervicola]QIZ74196.1 putative site-specific DNA endonuclease [Uronema confervicola]
MKHKREGRKSLIIAPGEKLPKEVLQQLKEANNRYTKNKDFPSYLKDIELIFNITPVKVTTDSKLYLAGFIGGEGSLNVSAKKQKNTSFGLVIDPEFSVTQHLNGAGMLYLALDVFQTGRIGYKSGSNATLFFRIDNRKSLQEKVMPFFRQYAFPYGSDYLVQRAETFQKLLNLFDSKAHLELGSFLNEVLPLWYSMRKQEGQVNQSFANLNEAQEYVKAFVAERQIKK